MELKCSGSSYFSSIFASSNRTFMELKYNDLDILKKEYDNVLIVPLWN